MKKICVTGAAGFVAMATIAELIKDGYKVKGTLRNTNQSSQVKTDLEEHLNKTIDIDFIKADLTQDEGWDEAVSGCDAIMHVASPFPAKAPKNSDDILIPAIGGTTRVLNAAAQSGIDRVVMTSSNAAIWFGNFNETHYDESTWSNINHNGIDDYTKSKTLAEKKAWELAEQNQQIKLTSINPSVVWGPGIGNHLKSTSLGLFKMIIKKEMPVVPNMKIPFVDIRDVAKMHVSALKVDDAVGKRFLITNEPAWMINFCNQVRDLGYEAPNKVAPNFMMKLISLVDSSMKPTIPMLGHDYFLNTYQAREILDFDPIPVETTIRDTASYLEKYL